jgi:hypothetical protein
LLGLPTEFDGLLTRLRPDEVRSGQPISPESKLFLENSAVIQGREICLFLACTGAGPFGSACVSELPEDNDRYRYTEVLYATNATTVKIQVEWYFEISGLEFLTLGTLTRFNCFISICIAFGAGVRLSAQPLVSPGDLGELIKPFVFLDLFQLDTRAAPRSMDMGWHPHSGIATITVLLEGATRYAETTGNEGVLPAGGVEFMRAGNGVWHTGAPEPGRVRGFQLWISLPPELENAANASHYVLPKDVPQDGPARVILGKYGSLQSPIAAPPMTYLSVKLKPGEAWSYAPPAGHTVAWVAVHQGLLRAPSPIPAGGA